MSGIFSAPYKDQDDDLELTLPKVLLSHLKQLHEVVHGLLLIGFLEANNCTCFNQDKTNVHKHACKESRIACSERVFRLGLDDCKKFGEVGPDELIVHCPAV